MKPPVRANRSNKLLHQNEKTEETEKKAKAPKKAKRPQRPKSGFEDEKWKLKEKRAVLEAMKDIKHFDRSRDLIHIQKRIPRRSVEEIDKFLLELSAEKNKRLERQKEEFDKTYLKQWITCCDSQSGLSSTCSETGEGTIGSPHPALALSEVMNRKNTQVPQVIVKHDKLTCNLGKVYAFIECFLADRDPFDNWSSNSQMESAVLIELMNDLQRDVSSCSFDKQHEHFFNKFRETKKLPISDDVFENPFPNDVCESKYLNPLGLTKELLQCVEYQQVPSNSD